MVKKELNKKIIVLSIIGLLMMIGITYAYFSARSQSETQTIITGKIGLTFDDTTPIVSATNIVPIVSEEILTKATKKSFNINSTSNTNDQYISIYLKDIIIDKDLISIDFKWALYENNRLIVDGNFNNINQNQILIKNNLKLQKNNSRNFDLYIWIQDNQEKQNYMQNKSLSAKIYVSGLLNKTEEYYELKNLFDNQTVLSNHFINYKNGNAQNNDEYTSSDYIEIKGNNYYSAGYIEPSGVYEQNCYHYAFYDENKNFINGYNGVFKTIKSPINAKYIRFDMSPEVSPTNLGIILDDPARYTVFVEGTELPNRYISYNNTEKILRTWYEDKNVVAYGDSITAMHRWYRTVSSQLGINSISNFGVSGRRISGTNGMCQDTQIQTLPNDLDMIFVMGGTNDWSNDVELGDINSVDTNTFYGALNIMVQKLQNRYPNKLIVLLSTLYGGGEPINNVGLTTIDYGNAVKNIAHKYNLNVVDLSTLWNDTDLNTYTSDTIHPNFLGGVLVGNKIVENLKLFEPEN